MLISKIKTYKFGLKKALKSLYVGLFAFIPLLAYADDLLAGTTIKQDVQDTFGTGSTFFYLMLVAEVIFACIAFVGKKHPMVFAGAIVLMIIPPVLIGLAGGF